MWRKKLRHKRLSRLVRCDVQGSESELTRLRSAYAIHDGQEPADFGRRLQAVEAADEGELVWEVTSAVLFQLGAQILPALEFEGINLLRRSLLRWQEALPLRVAVNHADDFYARRLMGALSLSSHSAAQVRHSGRFDQMEASRQGRPRPSSSRVRLSHFPLP
jgi:hypothetical protein